MSTSVHPSIRPNQSAPAYHGLHICPCGIRSTVAFPWEVYFPLTRQDSQDFYALEFRKHVCRQLRKHVIWKVPGQVGWANHTNGDRVSILLIQFRGRGGIIKSPINRAKSSKHRCYEHDWRYPRWSYVNLPTVWKKIKPTQTMITHHKKTHRLSTSVRPSKTPSGSSTRVFALRSLTHRG